jgi:hypothetical protein
MLLLFIFGVFISAIVATACGLIGYGLYTDSQSLAERDSQLDDFSDLAMPENLDQTITEAIEEEIKTEIIQERR